MRKTISVVHVLISGEAAKHKLTKQSGQCMPGVLAPTTVGKRHRLDRSGRGVVEFAIPSSPASEVMRLPVKFQMQSPVKIDPQRSIIRFTRRVFHEPTTMPNTTY
jgi:hypothetical protein